MDKYHTVVIQSGVVEHKIVLVGGSAIVAVSAIAYVAWRRQVHELSGAIEQADFERADRLAGDLLEAGELGREVGGLVLLLAACLAGMVLFSRVERARTFPSPTPEAFGFDSYL